MAEVPNFVMELETSSGSDNDKHNKHHKYALDEALQDVLDFNDEMITQVWLGLTLKYQANDCNQLQLVFVTDPLQ